MSEIEARLRDAETRLDEQRKMTDEAEARVRLLRRRIDNALCILGPLAEAVESECAPDGDVCHDHDMHEGSCALLTDLERALAALA